MLAQQQVADPSTAFDTLVGGFAPALPSYDDVASVAAQFAARFGVDRLPSPWKPSVGDWPESYPMHQFVFEISPGTVRVRTERQRVLPDRIPAAENVAQDPDDVLFEMDEPERPQAPRAAITSWSPRSRARMTERIAQLDLSAWSDQHDALAMVTLTLPGDWLTVAPTGAAFKRLMDRFRKRWERRLGPLTGVWKLEFQERGAPHLHFLARVPLRVGAARVDQWIATQWVAACDHPDLEQRNRQYRAHTHTTKDRPTGCVDVVDQWSDHRRIALYFNKHSSKTLDGKEYQHIVPQAWRAEGAGPGRFWGVWGLRNAVVRVNVGWRTFVRLRRILAGIYRGRLAAMQIDQLRAMHRPLGRSTLQRRRYQSRGGMWILTNDGLDLSFELARALSLMDT